MKKEIKVQTIYGTYDYDLFMFYEQNRPAGSNKRVGISMKKIDLSPYVPIVVTKTQSRKELYIIDGQNRYLACKELQLPIYYVILDDKIDIDEAIIALNRDQRAWSQKEFLHFHAATSGGCYKKLYDFDKQYNLGISNSAVVYPLRAINARTIRDWVTIFDPNPLAEDICRFIDSEEVKALRFRKTRPFVLAVRKAFERYTLRQLDKLKKRIIIVPMCANYEQYLTAFDNLIKR